MVHALHQHPERPLRDLTCLRSGGTLDTPAQIMRVVELGAHEICHIYGLTETYGNCNVTDARDPLEKRIGNVGRPLPGVDQRIVDPLTGQVLVPAMSARCASRAASRPATTRTRSAARRPSTNTATS